MAERLNRHLLVETCIACGARHRVGDCEAGCSEVALDLVEAAELAPLELRRAALEWRVNELRQVIEAFVRDPSGAWEDARAGGRAALARALPPEPQRPAVIEAWGCPTCGRVDAPQPCLDVCIRRPVEMADAAEYDELAARVAELERHERSLSEVVRLIVHVRAREGAAEQTRAALALRADEVLRSC